SQGTSGTGSDGGPAGTLKVLTHRTDLDENGTLQGYADKFIAKYPDVTAVEFESITAYDDDVPLRLSTGDFGDVLSIPNGVTNDQLAQFFEPFGTKADLSGKYQFLDSFAVGDQVYGLAQGGIATGVVYNKKVFEEAGVSEPPTSYDDFMAALQAVKDNTDAVPLYTNYKDGWPLGDLHRNMGVALGNADAKNDMTGEDAPWAEGSDAYWLDSLIYDAVDKGLTEEDPTTTNWEESKTLLGTGEVATLVLQSWAISQMQAAATDSGASADDIGFLPVPSAVAGKSFAAVLGDRYYAMNAKSENKATAKAWVEFMIEESGYDAAEGFVSTLKSAPLPSNLSALSDLGTELFEPAAPPAGEEGLFDAIDTAAEIGFSSAPYRQALVDQARQHTPKADAFGELNAKWAQGRASAG
ncbi:MAG: ABC transporter substrate-binding protein, partial [Bifidobacteriaceae bacterium]|nr:ABC transporter substrate-binding protein [Bifidobacteriaceae bacterium]